nr:hypothetical protein [Nocardioides sp. URHA0032]
MWATNAASAGPNSDGSTQAAAKLAKIAGWRTRGKTRPTSTYRPTVSAPPPRPWSTRPATSTSIDGARPQTTSPRANSASDATSGTAGPRRSLQAPAVTMPTTPLASGAANDSAYRPTPSRSAATVGITVVTAVASNATSAQSANMPTVVTAYAGESSRGRAAAASVRVTDGR